MYNFRPVTKLFVVRYGASGIRGIHGCYSPYSVNFMQATLDLYAFLKITEACG